MRRKLPSEDLFLEDSDRLFRRLLRGERLSRGELDKFCHLFALSGLSGFSRGLPVCTVAQSTFLNNVNLFTACGSITYPVLISYILNGSQRIGSTSTGSYALECGSQWNVRSKIFLRIGIGAIIAGKGGGGGTGGGCTTGGFIANGAGGTGGPAINAANLPVAGMLEITNSGNVQGGGGGGGGGGASAAQDGKGNLLAPSGGGGGGGGGCGETATGGGSGGTDNISTQHGSAGGTSSVTAGGGGGLRGQPGNFAGNGGAGGGAGSGGATGATGTGNVNQPGAGGGGAGVAVNGDSKIVWKVLGTIFGARVG